MKKYKESDLYFPIKQYLETLGYDVKGEVRHCDITAVKGDELIIVELKTGFTLELVYQGIRRQAIANSVYLAVPLPKRGYISPKYNDMVRLCKRLEVGLIFVGFTSNKTPQIDVAVHPLSQPAIRKNKKERFAVLHEHNSRSGSMNTGGVTRRKIITVYKEKALAVAKILADNENMTASEIRKLSGFENTSTILSKNHYKWYEKSQDFGNKKNTYRITELGLSALDEYKDLFQNPPANTLDGTDEDIS